MASGNSSEPRREVAASWRRVRALGLNPGSTPRVGPLTEAERQRRRAASGLERLVPALEANVAPVLRMGHLVVITDAEARVLWRLGDTRVKGFADRLDFVPGSEWTEANVGTNAIGTALVLGAPVQITGREHFVESHTRWACAAAPITDPWTGEQLGTLDISGPSAAMGEAALAVVDMAARLAGFEILESHRQALDRLRQRAAPLVSSVGGQTLAVDLSGHIAASIGLTAPEKITLPTDLVAGPLWLPGLGRALAEPLPGGWLLRLDDTDETAPTTLEVDLRGNPRAIVDGPAGRWVHDLTRRHAELLVALAHAGPSGASAAALSSALFGDRDHQVSVRAELSRLRKVFGGVLATRPYRIVDGVRVTLTSPTSPLAG